MGIRAIDPGFQKDRIAEQNDSGTKHLPGIQHSTDLQAHSS